MSTAAAVEPDEQASLAPAASVSRRDAVSTEIRRGIVLGALRPGEKLTELSLAGSLQVSRATVREALGQLAREGLVIAEPYRGLRVADLDLAAVRDLAKTRVALDMLAIAEIVADPTNGRIDAVRAAWATYERAIHDHDPFVRHQEHLAFHRAIWFASGNTFLAQLWPVIEANLTIVLAQDQAVRPSAERAYRMHAELVEVIAGRDLVEIERAVTAHTLTSADEFIALQSGRGAP